MISYVDLYSTEPGEDVFYQEEFLDPMNAADIEEPDVVPQQPLGFVTNTKIMMLASRVRALTGALRRMIEATKPMSDQGRAEWFRQGVMTLQRLEDDSEA